jgi:hypothetical protein
MAPDLAKRFMEAYATRQMLYLERSRVERELRERLDEQQILRRAIESNAVQESPSTPAEQATLYGAGIHRISVSSLGAFPTGDANRFYTETAIFPVGYTCKRKYRRHDSYTRNAKEKITYICTVEEGRGPVIRAEDGREWAGMDLWPGFCGSFSEPCELKSLAEFFGLSIPHLCRKIEALGDASIFHGYIPCDSRTKEARQGSS